MLLALLWLPVETEASVSYLAGAVTTAAGNLNVRSSPSPAAAPVASLKKGSYVTLVSKSGDWWQVEYGKNQFGYCHADYITVVEGTPMTVNISSGSLNVRSGGGTQYGRVASLSKGEQLIFLRSSGGWSRVLYHGTQTGYVSDRYLSGYRAPVSLDVPDLKQTDDRWAAKTIAGTGKTFAQIGCATTAIAMMESYRTGTVLLPDAVAQTLRYTASGDVYWPEHYTAVTTESLDAIYRLLSQGKPVLLGRKTQAGAQHWVVVTGYRGGVGLSRGQFTIRDPGSAYRSNLQQFTAAYPLFYKYFHD